MEALSVSELKGLCLQRRLPVSGTKAELIERLVRGSSAASSARAGASVSPAGATATTTATQNTTSDAGGASSALFPSDYDALTIPQLKDLCRERELPVGGIKDDIVARLKASDPRNMNLAQLKERCRDAALPVTGTKSDLVDRVMKSMSSGTTALLQTKSVEELKDLCRERGVGVTGKKDELIERIKQASTASSATAKLPSKGSAEKSTPPSYAPKKSKAKAATPSPSYVFMTIPQLKDLCREKKLTVGGTKDELVERLEKAAPQPAARPSSASKSSTSSASATAPASVAASMMAGDSGYEAMMVPQLKDLCRSRTLPVMGTKDELVNRLKEHDDVVRAMFKKRKSASSASISTSSTAAPAASSGKRKAGTDEPKAKKAKVSVTKSASSSMRPPMAKNVSSFAMPATTTYAARKSAPAKTNAGAAQPSTGNGRYVVYSTFAYPPDGFHSYAGPGEPKYYGSYATKEEANARVNTLFYHSNPWGLDKDELDDNHDIDEDWKDGLLRLEVCPPDSQQWVVAARDTGVVASGNVSAPSTMAARKSVPAKAKEQSVHSSTANGRYLVYSTCAYPPDGFHSYQGPGEPEYHGRYATKEEANDRVNTLFYHKNPWGLGADEMDENQDIDEDWKDGLLRLEVCPPDSEQWVVGVKDVDATADHDGDVIMVSGSDTEDEYRSGY